MYTVPLEKERARRQGGAAACYRSRPAAAGELSLGPCKKGLIGPKHEIASSIIKTSDSDTIRFLRKISIIISCFFSFLITHGHIICCY
jgi:hypothetical protein